MSSEWQPIETAPKDGTELLLYERRERFIDDDFVEVDYIFSGAWNAESYQGECWECSEYEVFSHEPTHWMPLPEVPK